MLSPLHTMLAHTSHPPVHSEASPAAQDRVSVARAAPPASYRDSSPPCDVNTRITAHLLATPATADADVISSLAAVDEETSESALQGRAETHEPGQVARGAPCIGRMRARGLRQQRLSQEHRRGSVADMAPGQSGPVLAACYGVSGAAAAMCASGRGGKADASLRRAGSQVGAGLSGGAGAVLVRQRMRPKSRLSGEVGFSCGVLFGQDVGRVR